MRELIKIEFGTPAFDNAIDLRYRVLRIPLNLSFEIKDIELEYLEDHYGLLDTDMSLLACLSYRHLSDTLVKMRQVAVEPALVKQGLGKEMVLASEDVLRSQGIKEIELNARDVALAFYKKIGYKTVGKAFTEVGIKHYKMTKKL